MVYKYRHRETYKGEKIDVKAHTTGELIRKVDAKRAKIDRQFLDPDTTLRVFVDMYLDTYKANTVSPDTLAYLRVLASKICEGIGSNRKVGKIKPLQVQEYLNSLTDYKSSYIRKLYQLTCQIFKHAYRNGLTTTDYTAQLELPKGRATETGRSLTDRERKVLLKVLAGHRGELFCKLMLYCGLRPSEAQALTWQNVDLRAETITIDKSISRSGFVSTGKSEASRRTVPIPHHLVPLLQEHRGSPFERVCPFNEGQRRAMWKSVKRAMNIQMGCRVFNNQLQPPYPLDPHFTMYNLRHTYCTDLERAGVPINVARRLMGHASIAITSAIYTHDNVESMEDARDRINGTVGNSVGNNQRKAHG